MHLFRRAPGRGVARPLAEPETFDVTGFSNDIDLRALDVIAWAPCWMSRAERLLLFTLAFTLRPRRYLEVGLYQGGSALIVSAAMDALDHPGRVVSIDPDPKMHPDHWQRISHRATIITGASPNALPAAESAAGGRFDFVLIDGDHTREGVLRDTVGVMGHVTEGAYILCHDGLNAGVARGLQEFLTGQGARVIDCGLLTREVTFLAEGTQQARWGGLRLMRVATEIGAS
jgi:hypothetical protein